MGHCPEINSLILSYLKCVKQRKYCDKLAENLKSVFVCNIIMVGLFYFNFFKILLFEWPTFSMTYFHVFFRTCWAFCYITAIMLHNKVKLTQ